MSLDELRYWTSIEDNLPCNIAYRSAFRPIDFRLTQREHFQRKRRLLGG
jgi:hypothetical protein